VRKLRKSVYLLMAMTVLSAPLLACTLPGITMSEEEKECCRHMADQCGSSQMEESHSCCTRTSILSAETQQPVMKYSPLVPDLVSDAVPSQAQSRIVGAAASVADILGCSKSPPGYVSVLRI